jgi:hypothetical protein
MMRVMDATRVRFVALIEWLLAAIVIVGATMLGSILIRDSRTMQAVTPVIAGEYREPEVPPGVPARAVSLPILLLAHGKEVRIGATAADVSAQLGEAAQIGADELQRTTGVERVVRFYNYAGTLFVLVFDGSGSNGQLRVSSIYLQ